MRRKLLAQDIVCSASKILVVDNQPATRNLIYRFFRQKNYQIESAGDGLTAMSVFERFLPHLVILDVNLPDTTGFYLCQEMQRRTNVHVLLLTSRSHLQDKLTGFKMGADDYMTKPFDLLELQYRVKALLRRQQAVATFGRLVFNHLVIDPMRREVTLNEQPVILTFLEFELLYFLASHPNQICSRSQLIQHAWGYKYVGDQQMVSVHISQIRKKIEIDANQPSLIQTVRGVGYKFEVPYNRFGHSKYDKTLLKWDNANELHTTDERDASSCRCPSDLPGSRRPHLHRLA